jgi:hypothetical protein
MSGVKFLIVAGNNHYVGFAPRTVNIFRQLLGIDALLRDYYVLSDICLTNLHLAMNSNYSI